MFSPAAERLNVINVPLIVNVGDERDMGVGPGCYLQLPCDGILEVDQGIHIRPGCSQHIVTPEDNLHLEFVVPDNALDQLQAGAIRKFLI